MFLCLFSCMINVHTWRDSPVVCFHIHILISPIPMTYELYSIHFDFSCLYSSGHACHMTRALLSISYSYTFVLALLTIYRLSHLTVVYESHFLSSLPQTSRPVFYTSISHIYCFTMRRVSTLCILVS